MSSADRLTELQRQRALAQAQLDWFDREIAKESAPAALSATLPKALPAQPVALPASPMGAQVPEAADDLIARFNPSPAHTAQDVKRGCMLYAGLAMAALILVTLVAYFLYTRR